MTMKLNFLLVGVCVGLGLWNCRRDLVREAIVGCLWFGLAALFLSSILEG
jgi:hypothetical protein